MTQEVEEWLAGYFDTDTNRIEELLTNQLATTYLLIWPIFEQKFFNGFMKKSEIKRFAADHAECYGKMNSEYIIKYFHKRYQDNNNYHHLKHRDNCSDIDEILKKSYDKLKSEEKLALGLYVVYRYRNNIFHGNKGIKSWVNYKTQIEYCLQFMMRFIDCAREQTGDQE